MMALARLRQSVRRRSVVVLGASLLAFCTSCRQGESSNQGPVRRAQFGVFFGGQVQEREQIPFELDRARQVQGIRLEFSEPLRAPLTISWEINRPQKVGRAPAGARDGRVLQTGRAEARAGQTRFEQIVAFDPGDPLGTWNVRVLAGERLVIDRRFLVYDAHERARAMHAHDAGISGEH